MHSDLDPKNTPAETPAAEIAQRLRELPTDLRPPFDYEEFQRRVREQSRPHRAVKWQHAAAAGGIVTVLAVFAVWSRFGQLDEEFVVPAVSAVERANPLPRFTVVDPMSAARARAAERWLSNLPAEPAIVRVDTRFAVAKLEDRIAWVDDALTDERLEGVNPAHLAALQQERVRLINSLAQVRYAETLAAQVP
jgi:hypothetical protein